MKADLPDHRKFLRLVRLLGEPVPHVLGYLSFMWRRSYQTGNPLIGDELDVEAAAMYSGEPGKFTAAATTAGFIDRREDGTYVIHDLWDHAPVWAKKRMARNGFASEGSEGYAGGIPTGKKKAGTVPARKDNGNETGPDGPARKAKKRLERGKKKEEKPPPQTPPPEGGALPADAGEGRETKLPDPAPAVEQKPRPRNELFDAVAEVSGLDPATAGGRIGTATADLKRLDPPFTPDEVREFGRRFWELCTWAAKEKRDRPTPQEIATWGPKLRASPVPHQRPPPGSGGFQTRGQAELNSFTDTVLDTLQKRGMT